MNEPNAILEAPAGNVPPMVREPVPDPAPPPVAQMIPMPARPARIQLKKLPTAARNPEELAALRQMIQELGDNAAADNHEVLGPTHVMVKADEIVGYVSIAGLPLMNFWADSHKLHAGESLKMIEQGEVVAAEHGFLKVCVPCAADSPFAAHMERLGYRKLGVTTLYVKDL